MSAPTASPTTTSAPRIDRPDLYAILMAPQTWTAPPAATLERAVAAQESLWSTFERRADLASYYRLRGVPAFVRELPTQRRPD